jgi:hypothetical protein
LDGYYRRTWNFLIDSDFQLKRASVYFNEAVSGIYFPRAMFTDLEPGTLDMIRARSYGNYSNQITLSSDEQVMETTGLGVII